MNKALQLRESVSLCIIILNSNGYVLAILKKGEGLGGRVTSLNKPKERP
jgi:hypothetical protein